MKRKAFWVLLVLLLLGSTVRAQSGNVAWMRTNERGIVEERVFRFLDNDDVFWPLVESPELLQKVRHVPGVQTAVFVNGALRIRRTPKFKWFDMALDLCQICKPYLKETAKGKVTFISPWYEDF